MKAREIDSARLEELLKSEKPVLVDFWAPWCTYCRRISDAYDRIAEQYGDRLHVVKVNIDDNEALAMQESIEVIPTLVQGDGFHRRAGIQGDDRSLHRRDDARRDEENG